MSTVFARGHAAVRALTLAGLFVGGLSIAFAADWPVFKPGQWQLERTMEGAGPTPQKVSSTKCMDPAAERLKQREMLTKAGCEFSPLTQSGTTYRYSATCRMGGMTATSNSVLEAQGAEAYTITIDSVTDGVKSHEVLKARRVGDCAK